ncbi:MAG: hypothetical protein WCO00_14075 [Rhodospirillaceae bacterium]
MTTQSTFSFLALTLEYIGINTWDNLLETIFLLVGAAITGVVSSEALIYLWQLRISLHQDLMALRQTLEGRLPVVKRFRERHAKLTRQIDHIDDEIGKLTTRQGVLTNQLRQLQEVQSRHVRTIGQQIKGSKCFRALVTNTYVKNYVMEGKRHPLFDDSWARAQIVEIWSSSKPFALIALRQEYSQAQGFAVDKIEPIDN